MLPEPIPGEHEPRTRSRADAAMLVAEVCSRRRAGLPAVGDAAPAGPLRVAWVRDARKSAGVLPSRGPPRDQDAHQDRGDVVESGKHGQQGRMDPPRREMPHPDKSGELPERKQEANERCGCAAPRRSRQGRHNDAVDGSQNKGRSQERPRRAADDTTPPGVDHPPQNSGGERRAKCGHRWRCLGVQGNDRGDGGHPRDEARAGSCAQPCAPPHSGRDLVCPSHAGSPLAAPRA